MLYKLLDISLLVLCFWSRVSQLFLKTGTSGIDVFS